MHGLGFDFRHLHQRRKDGDNLPKFEDITGQRFGKLVVISYLHTNATGNAYWNTKCDCGTIGVTRGSYLRTGRSRSCGCLRLERESLVGERFGRLIVISFSHIDNGHNSHWNTVCDCGNTSIVNGSILKRGDTKSCGCLQKEKSADLCRKKIGRLNSNWNEDLTDEDRARGRQISGYKKWRIDIYKRDDYTCQKCGKRGGCKLNAHRIEGFADNPELRTSLSNGTTLCKDCHKEYHHLHGHNHATREKFEEWINT